MRNWDTHDFAAAGSVGAGNVGVLIQCQVRVFDGIGPALSTPTRVLAQGNMIAAIGPEVAAPDA